MQEKCKDITVGHSIRGRAGKRERERERERQKIVWREMEKGRKERYIEKEEIRNRSAGEICRRRERERCLV